MLSSNASKLKAAGIHLAASATVAALCIYLVYGIWYPAPLYTPLGVIDIFLVLIATDIVLGPLMTLVVYRPLKNTLKFDLTIIACIQLAALLYGMHTVGSGRPAYIVFTKDRFDLVQAYEVASIVGTQDNPELSMQSPWTQPLFGYGLKSAAVPSGPSNYPLLSLLMGSALSGGPDIPHAPAFHEDYAKAFPKIKATASTFATLKPKDDEGKARITQLQAKYPANSLLSPLKIKYTIYTVVMSPVDASILGIEPVDVF